MESLPENGPDLVSPCKFGPRPRPLPQEKGPVPSIPGQNAVHQLLYGRDEAVRVERVLLEIIGVVAGEHQVLVDRAAMGDVLQRLLDAEAARIGEAAGRVGLVVRPARESA